MISLLFAAALAAQANMAPDPDSTLGQVTSHGIVLSAQGFDIDVDYTPDGKFTAFDGQITGTWRADGDKLCTTSNAQPEESCTAYPEGKKSGDSFDLATPDGQSVTIKIK